MMLWWKWELDAERRRRDGSIGAVQHGRSLTDIDPRPNPSQFPSYVVTSNYVSLHLESSSRGIRKLQQHDDAHINAAHRIKHTMLRDCTEWSVCVFLCVRSTFLCPNAWNPWGKCATLFVITSPFEEKMNAFPSSSPPPPLFSPPPAESCCLGGKTWLQRCTNPGDTVRKAGVYFPWEFFACVMNRVYIQNSSPRDPSCFLL